MRTILFPTDFSDHANDALKYALSLVRDHPSRLIIINVFDVPHSHAGVLKSIKDIMRSDSEEGLRETRALVMMDERNRQLNIEYVSKMGGTISEIRKASSEYEADLIIIGTKGASGLEEVLIGSTTSNLMKSSGCPVLAIPENVSYQVPKTIVYSADLRKAESSQSLKALVDMANLFRSKVDIMHVNNSGDKDLFKTPEAMSITYALGNIPHEFHVVSQTDIVKGIEEFMSHPEREMLFMVMRKYNLIEALFHSSVTEKIAHHVTRPLLVSHE